VLGTPYPSLAPAPESVYDGRGSVRRGTASGNSAPDSYARPVKCPACGTANPGNARFCLSCGHQLVARNDERRIATVLFADLVGFTHLSETRDPEQVKRLVDDCFELLGADITAFGGKIDKILGDAIVALFGAPVAHEDDAERAVRAALRMQESLATYASTAAAADLKIRIGVNTGEVLVGALRAGGDYTAMGDVVNTAQRLQTTAEPGSVVVGPATFLATQETIEYESIGKVQAKGRDEPVDAWVAVEPLLPPGYRRRRVQTPFVGRDAELGVMRHAVDTAVERSRAHFLLILGEAGVGKSRLAEETAKLARMRHRALVFEGRCVPYGEANVWWPVAEALRQACGIAADAPMAEADRLCHDAVAAVFEATTGAPEVKRVVNGLLFLMGYPVALRDIDPQRAREEATRSVLSFVEASTRSRPVVILLSDLHWADAALLEMVDELIDQLARCPFVLVASARHELLTRWSAPTGRHNSVVTHLDPLDRNSTDELLSALADDHAIDGPVREALLDRSGGNPFFLEELVALVGAEESPASAGSASNSIGNGSSTFIPGRRSVPEPGLAGSVASGLSFARAGHQLGDLPDTLRGLVAARIDALSPAERVVLEDAAVWGRSGPTEALERMTEQIHHGGDVPAAIEALIDHDVLELDGERWRFRSDLVREVAYGTLTKADRARRHTGIGYYLEHSMVGNRLAGATDRQAAIVAHHYATAASLVDELGSVDGITGDLRRKAISWLEEAAARAERAQTLPVARQLYSQALRLLPSAPDADPQRGKLLLGRAAAATELRALDEARIDIDEAMLLAETLDDNALRARALLVLGDHAQKAGDLDGALVSLAAAVEQFEALEDEKGRADALRSQGLTQLFLGENADAEASIGEAHAAYRAADDRRGEAWAMQNLAWISYIRGRAGEAEQRISEAVGTFQDLGDSGGLSWSLGLLAFVKMHEGRHAEAEELGKQVLVEARQRGDRWGEGMMLLLMSLVRLWSGRVDAAVVAAQDALGLFKLIGDRFGEMQATAVLARAEVTAGHVEEGMARINTAYDAFATAAHHDETKHFLATVLAATAVQIGAPELAVNALAVAPEPGVDDEPGAIGSVDRRVARGLAFLQLGRLEAALDELLLAVDDEESTGAGPISAWAQGALALGLVTAGRLDEAETWAEAAVASTRATYLDRSLGRLARLFVAHRRGESIDAALSCINDELEGTDDRMLTAIVGIARAVLADAGSRESGSASPTEAERRDTELSFLGIEATGWHTLFAAAAGG